MGLTFRMTSKVHMDKVLINNRVTHIKIFNGYGPNNGASEYKNPKLIELKMEIDP